MEVVGKSEEISDKIKKQINSMEEEWAELLQMDEKIDALTAALEKNTAMTAELLKELRRNNYCTEFIFDKMKVSLSSSQQAKDFAMNLLANLLADIIAIDDLTGRRKR